MQFSLRQVAEFLGLRLDAPVGAVDDWEWRGPRPELGDWCTRFGSSRLAERAAKLAAQRGVGA